MRVVAVGLLTFLLLIKSSTPHAQVWNSPVTPLNPVSTGMFVRAPVITTTRTPVAASTIQTVNIACAKVEAKAATRLAAIPFLVDISLLIFPC
jgi:hypothetical protein